MSVPPPPSALPLPPPPRPLYKQRSWSPSSPSDMYSDEAWLRRKGAHRIRRTSSSSSITDDDLDELKACIELGLVFDSPDLDHRKLSDTLPALGLYYASKKQYNDSVSTNNNTGNSPTLTPSASSSSVSECDVLSPVGSPNAIFEPGENPQLVKTRLKQWAQVVACMVRMRHSK
ncbi:hypothetical protein MKW98_025767 [Papaver atlanticum]|uniref:Uncharacterized protein n=1 Tax=Papaver atlanticum TaxID=357466 RepID=A0AAD4SDN3_9MAGN|nr:hypothetical protein MKW98_025767 [Papaver atlanticum]